MPRGSVSTSLGRMDTLFTVLTIAVVVVVLGLAAWVFVLAPLVVPFRHQRQ